MTWPQVAGMAVLSFGLTVVFTAGLIPFLHSRQLGKAIREDGPDHQAKAGTPTMGGIAMLAAIAIAAAVFAPQWTSWRMPPILPTSDPRIWLGVAQASPVWICIAAMAVFALLGLVDDWSGLARRGQAREVGVGVTARRMFALQLAAGVLLVLLGVPLFGPPTSWSWFLIPLGVAILLAIATVGTVNGVNMSDGLDGLAAGLLAAAFASTGTAAHLLGPARGPQGVSPVVALAFAAAAACLGFLIFNRHPARVFMGNVASMGLGGLLAMLALYGGAILFLPLIGAVFVAEVVSVLIQVGYFRLSGGKRVFRMAPIHHHFELGGWSETKVVHRFWLFGLVSAVAGVAMAAVVARP